MIDRRHTFDKMAIKIAIIMLRKVNKVSRPTVINSYIDSWELVETNIVISNNADNRHQVSKGRSHSAIHSEEIVPSVGTSWHIIVVGYITSNKENVRLKSSCNFREV